MANNNTAESTLCCGRPMTLKTDMGRAWEAVCMTCGDTIYIKKDMPKPSLLDD